MYKKKHTSNIIWIVSIVVLLFSIFYLLNNRSQLPVDKLVKDFFYSPTRLIPDNDQTDIIGSNINTELEEEIKELKDLLGIKNTLSEFDIINATVIERNTAYWFNLLTINKGKKDGINVGMAVVTNEGIVGRIENVSYLTSTVKLITSNDTNNKISVRIDSKDKKYNSILTTDENGNMIITGIDKDNNIKIGDPVTSSGLSNVFPSGIIIGKVSRIENDEYGTSKKLFIESQTNMNDIRFVGVLSRKLGYE